MSVVGIVSSSLKYDDCTDCRITSGCNSRRLSVSKPILCISTPSDVFMIRDKIGTIPPCESISLSGITHRVYFTGNGRIVFGGFFFGNDFWWYYLYRSWDKKFLSDKKFLTLGKFILFHNLLCGNFVFFGDILKNRFFHLVKINSHGFL